MHEMVERQWPGDENKSRRDAYWARNLYDPSNTKTETLIIELNGEKIGRIAKTLEEDKGRIFMNEVHILPGYGALEIVSRKVDELFEYADKNNLPIALTVLEENWKAHKLYKMLGFIDDAEQPELHDPVFRRYQMTRQPKQQNLTATSALQPAQG